MNLSPINPTSPGFIDRFPVKKVALVTTILLLVLGIILIIGGSVGFMPLLPAVISGAILLGVVASVGGFQLVRHLSKDKKAELKPKDSEEIPETIAGTPKISDTSRTSGMTEIAGVKFNEKLMKEANSWCKEELKKRREMSPEDRANYLHNEIFANSPFIEKGDTIWNICYDKYPEAFRLVCEVGYDKRGAYGVILGCYPILIESLIQRKRSDEEFLRMKPLTAERAMQAKTLPENERLLYFSGLINHSTALAGISAGMGWLFRSYMTLKTGIVGANHGVNPDAKVDPQDFYTPGTDAYFARQIFNSARETFLSIFPLELLENHAKDSPTVKFLYEACLVPDEGPEFLTSHKDYEYLGRAYLASFCN